MLFEAAVRDIYSFLVRSGRKQPNTACWSTNFTHFAYLAYLSFELRMIFRSIERTCNTRGTAIYWCVRRRTDVKFCELIEFNVDFVLRTTFTLRLYFLRLVTISGYAKVQS